MKNKLGIIFCLFSIIITSCKEKTDFVSSVSCKLKEDTLFIDISIKNNSNNLYYLYGIDNVAEGLNVFYLKNNTIYFDKRPKIGNLFLLNSERKYLDPKVYNLYKGILEKNFNDTLSKDVINRFCIETINHDLKSILFFKPNATHKIIVKYYLGDFGLNEVIKVNYIYRFKVYETICMKGKYLPSEIEGYTHYKKIINSDTFLIKHNY